MGNVMSELRRQIGESGMSRNAIAWGSGVSLSAVSRLLSGERPDMMTASAEAIAGAIGCEIIIRRRPGKGKGKHGKGKATREAR